MSFLHAYLLGGLALTAAPILIHLVTREKPKHLRFPAFRFLLQKYQTNRRKLRLHHLLLLLLRMLLIAALCFALSRPRLYSDRLQFLGGTQPILVALLVDTSPSMEFERGGLTRLEDARRRALELLEEMPEGSRVALLDSAEVEGQFETPANVQEQLKALQIRHGNRPVSRLLERAYKLLNEEAEQRGGEGEPLPRYLYLFSDRTRASWDPGDVRGLAQQEGISTVYIDVGSDKATDLAIEQLAVEPPAAPPGSKVQIRAVVGATGERADRKITCQINNDPRLQEKLVQLEEGTRQVVVFEYRTAALGADPAKDGGLPAGLHQAVVWLEGNDRLRFNNVQYGTFVVRPGRKVLTLMDEVDHSHPWPLALKVLGFTSVVRAIRDLDKEKTLEEYDVICLHQVTDPGSQWRKLYEAVSDRGRKLAIIPGSTAKTYNDSAEAKQLLPGKFIDVKKSDRGGGTGWDWSLANTSPLMAPFLRWRREQADLEFWKASGEPRVQKWWEVEPVPEGRVIARYADGKTGSPALLERDVGRGKVLLFTSRLDLKRETIHEGLGPLPWSNYWQNSFGFILADKACRYLAGDSVAPDLNYICGQTVTIPLGRESGEQFVLRGPGLPPLGLPMTPPPEEKGQADRILPITQAALPGNYTLSAVRHQRQEVVEAFSMNVKPDESVLLPRVPREEIEETLGKDTVLDIDHNISLKDAISKKPQPLELLPYLMLLLLLMLAAENLLGNRSRDKGPPPEPAPAAQIVEKAGYSWRPLLLLFLWTVLGAAVGAGLAMLRGSTANSVLAGAAVTGLLGTFHGILSLARFGPRDGAILGGLLGSIVGVLYGWLILGMVSGFDGMFAVFLGLVLGAGVLALDGWVCGLRAAALERAKQALPQAEEKGPSWE